MSKEIVYGFNLKKERVRLDIQVRKVHRAKPPNGPLVGLTPIVSLEFTLELIT